jgi:hypothetical protein
VPKFNHSLDMSFLFGGGRPQPSSAEKIAAAETEVEMISDMFARYAILTWNIPFYDQRVYY